MLQAYSVNYWLSLGATPDILNIGLPLYGRSFTLQDPGVSGVGAPANEAGRAGRFTQENGYLAFYEVTATVKVVIYHLKLESRVVTLTACFITGALAALSVKRVDICQGCWVVPICDRLTCGVGGRDTGREGQGLHFCVRCKRVSLIWSHRLHCLYEHHHIDLQKCTCIKTYKSSQV